MARPKGQDYGTVRELLEARNISRDELATLLAEHGIATTADALQPARPIRKRWAVALGLASPPPASSEYVGAQGTPESDPLGRPDERPPREPAGAKQAPLPVAITQIAKERIAGTYGLVGEGVAMATGNAAVGQVFGAYSDPIADAWLKAAEENEFAARVVKLMSAGGATGELVTMHIVLVGGLLYVTGRAPALEGLYGRRFGPPPIVKPARASGNGSSADASADDAVGDASTAAT